MCARFCIILLLCFSTLKGVSSLDELPYEERFENAEVELLISYKVVSKDNLAQRESYRVSHVMNYQAHKGYIVTQECEIDASRYPIMDDMAYYITSIIKQEKEQVLECLLQHKVYVREDTSGRDNALQSRVRLEIAPTRVKAKLVNKSIMMYILAKEQV